MTYWRKHPLDRRRRREPPLSIIRDTCNLDLLPPAVGADSLGRFLDGSPQVQKYYRMEFLVQGTGETRKVYLFGVLRDAEQKDASNTPPSLYRVSGVKPDGEFDVQEIDRDSDVGVDLFVGSDVERFKADYAGIERATGFLQERH
jgi:hypothetical protein